jgi:hypothetical protein
MQAAPMVSAEKKTGFTQPVRVRGRYPFGTSIGAACPQFRQQFAGGWIIPHRGHQRTGDVVLVRVLNPDSQTRLLCGVQRAYAGMGA